MRTRKYTDQAPLQYYRKGQRKKKKRKNRSNAYIWSFYFVFLISLILFGAMFNTLKNEQKQLNDIKSVHVKSTNTHLQKFRHDEATYYRLKSKYQHNRDYLMLAKVNLTEKRKHPNVHPASSSSGENYCGSVTSLEEDKNTKRILILEEVDFPGGDLSDGPAFDASTINLCCIACSNNKECIGFTFVLSSKQCWLKKETNQRILHPGTVSGIKPDAEAAQSKETEEFQKLMHEHDKQNQEHEKIKMSIWPIPHSLEYSGGYRIISSNMKFNLIAPTIKSSRLQRTLNRYKNRMMINNKPDDTREIKSSSSRPLQSLNIECTQCTKDDGMEWSKNHDDDTKKEDQAISSFTLIMKSTSNDIILKTNTYNGLISGLETLLQFCFNGYCNATNVNIHDYAKYKYRGIMLDTGRRFIPLSLLRIIINLMSSLHFNVLHLHLTDWSAIRFQSNIFPNLDKGSNDNIHRQYNQDAIEQLQVYANDRGIYIIPEIDVPGHASSFRPLNKNDGIDNSNDESEKTVHFCSNKKHQLYHDPSHSTLHTLQLLLDEMNNLFMKSPIIHVGGDETMEQGKCKKNDISELTSSMQSYVKDYLNKVPMVWNEVDSILNSVNNDTIVQCWNNCNVGTIALKGHRVVYSLLHDLYIDQVSKHCTLQGSLHGQCLWIDISKQMYSSQFKNNPNIKLLIGGEAAMWTDEYCPREQCVGHGDGWGGKVGWMYHKDKDEHFIKSMLGILFPRLLLVAGSFWNYKNDYSIKKLIYDYSYSAYRLEQLAKQLYSDEYSNNPISNNNNEDEQSITCPWNCKGGCTESSRCGIDYTNKKVATFT